MNQGIFSVGIPWKYGKKKNKYQVKPYYKNLKEEIMNYQYLDYEEYPNIVNKAAKYAETGVAKSLKNRIYSKNISPSDLICIIMYCDYTELSRDFTLSFRKSHQFELLKQIKEKNSEYYHWSKGLKNVIKYYGQRNQRNGQNGLLSKLKGPFYCGMSVILNIPDFQLYIRSPTSTSLHLEVAVKVKLNSLLCQLSLTFYFFSFQENLEWF